MAFRQRHRFRILRIPLTPPPRRSVRCVERATQVRAPPASARDPSAIRRRPIANKPTCPESSGILGLVACRPSRAASRQQSNSRRGGQLHHGPGLWQSNARLSGGPNSFPKQTARRDGARSNDHRDATLEFLCQRGPTVARANAGLRVAEADAFAMRQSVSVWIDLARNFAASPSVPMFNHDASAPTPDRAHHQPLPNPCHVGRNGARVCRFQSPRFDGRHHARYEHGRCNGWRNGYVEHAWRRCGFAVEYVSTSTRTVSASVGARRLSDADTVCSLGDYFPFARLAAR